MNEPTKRRLLILDLDETLIYGTSESLDRRPDFVVGPYFIYERPHVHGFLRQCAERFDLAVWTSASADYAQGVIRELKPDEAQFVFVWDRMRCTQHLDPESREPIWLKDLKKVKRLGYALEQIVVVEDSPENLARHYGNLVRIRPYRGEQEDQELLLLARYLVKFSAVPNVRTVDKRHWRQEAERDQGVQFLGSTTQAGRLPERSA